MSDSVPSARYSSVCNVLLQWSISLIPTYRVYRFYDNNVTNFMFFLAQKSAINYYLLNRLLTTAKVMWHY